jgi:hypothetical protein
MREVYKENLKYWNITKEASNSYEIDLGFILFYFLFILVFLYIFCVLIFITFSPFSSRFLYCPSFPFFSPAFSSLHGVNL